MPKGVKIEDMSRDELIQALKDKQRTITKLRTNHRRLKQSHEGLQKLVRMKTGTKLNTGRPRITRNLDLFNANWKDKTLRNFISENK